MSKDGIKVQVKDIEDCDFGTCIAVFVNDKQYGQRFHRKGDVQTESALLRGTIADMHREIQRLSTKMENLEQLRTHVQKVILLSGGGVRR